jgi:mRNA interferase MazF
MVVYDGDDDDLLVAPVTSQAARTSYDVVLVEWQRAGLRLPSVARLEKLATVEKAAVLRRLGFLQRRDLAAVQAALRRLLATILAAPI